MKWLIALPRRVRNRAWPFWLQFRQLFRAAVQASGVTITVLTAVYSTAIALLLWGMDKGMVRRRDLFDIDMLALWAILSVVLILCSGWIALRTADPETYARVLLGGRPEKEVLFTISKRIDRTCSRSLRLSTWAEELLKRLATIEGEPPQPPDFVPVFLPSGRWRRGVDRSVRRVSLVVFGLWKLLPRTGELARENENAFLEPGLRDEIQCLVWWLRRFPQRLHTRLLRIETMKLRASAELDIPSRRICDHLFQYSPAMHRDRLEKYVQNWGRILDSRPDTKDEERRLRDMVIQNVSFLNNTRRRRRYQREILENRDLHPYIVQFASKHSTSGSLQTYAEALRFVAMLGMRRLAGTRGEAREREMQAIRTRLAFLYRKQRAHPGFDLHALLLRALGCMEPERPDLREALGLLEELSRAPRPESGSQAPLDVSEARLGSFRDLSFRLAALVDSSRQAISEKFKSICGDWLSGKSEIRYIVSHGYSRTVLSVLRNSLPAPGKEDELLPRLFFLLPDEKESFDTRVMEYELKEKRTLRPFRNFAAGNEKHLLALLKDTDQVLILLGAECFDKERRMVHPRGFRPLLAKILKEMEGRVCRVVVVAESYKRNKDLLIADTRFYGQHFDRIDLYPPELIHCVITDEETLRSPSWP